MPATQTRPTSRRDLQGTQQENFRVYLAGEAEPVFYVDSELARRWLNAGAALAYRRKGELILRAKVGLSVRDLLFANLQTENGAANDKDIPNERWLELWEAYLRDRKYSAREPLSPDRHKQYLRPYVLKPIGSEAAEF